MSAPREIVYERFQSPFCEWISAWITYREGRVQRVEWATHLPHRVRIEEQRFGGVVESPYPARRRAERRAGLKGKQTKEAV